MLLTDHVALVSLSSTVSLRELMLVAAAVQKQVSRDFAPIWGVRGTVDPFASLVDIPSDYYTVIIFDDPQELLDGLATTVGYARAVELVETFDSDQCTGIHTNAFNRQPFALVRATDDAWTTVVSHEVLEMLSDPHGNRLIAASHVLDAQVRVDYLLEVCDPCQTIWYTVNGQRVSDFYTPRYFDPVRNDVSRFSFTGELTYPLQILDGGYISYIDSRDGGLYYLEGGTMTSRLVSDRAALAGSTTALRTLVDSNPRTPRISAAVMRSAAGAPAAPTSGEAVRVASQQWGAWSAEAVLAFANERG
jgi:hypothetical protein